MDYFIFWIVCIAACFYVLYTTAKQVYTKAKQDRAKKEEQERVIAEQQEAKKKAMEKFQSSPFVHRFGQIIANAAAKEIEHTLTNASTDRHSLTVDGRFPIAVYSDRIDYSTNNNDKYLCNVNHHAIKFDSDDPSTRVENLKNLDEIHAVLVALTKYLEPVIEKFKKQDVSFSQKFELNDGRNGYPAYCTFTLTFSVPNKNYDVAKNDW